MYRDETLIDRIVDPGKELGSLIAVGFVIRLMLCLHPHGQRLAPESIFHGTLQRNPRSSNHRLAFFPDDARCKSTEQRLRLGSMTFCIRP
jgi:hypothetical protein